tara:strand:+ start:1371 stop:1517 length:147 start_codon:yes stop_codon:yes gene_type:complete
MNYKNEWLKQKMLADEFKDKLIEYGEDDFVSYTEKQTNRTIKLIKENE